MMTSQMQFHSTKYQAPNVSFKQALMHSEAPDGGLYTPDIIPTLPKAFFNNLIDMSLNEIAFVVSNSMFGNDIPSVDLKRITDTAINFKMPLKQVDENLYMLELFHGPTHTIKDIGSRFLGLLLNYVNRHNKKTINVLLATCGNTGNAVSLAMSNIPGINVITLYPSERPDHQLINNHSDNVHLVPINGSMVDCRRLINEAMNDESLCDSFILTSANSTNIGRTLFHAFIYFYGYSQLLKINPNAGKVVFGVPSANCGTLLAGCIAKKMGLPISKLFACCNTFGSINNYINDITQPIFKDRQESAAYALDVHTPSNLSRIIDFYGSKEALQNDVQAYVVPDSEIIDAISNGFHKMDPHTALAYLCTKNNIQPGQTGIILATAHPDVSLRKTQTELPHAEKRSIMKANGHPLPPTFPALKKRLSQMLQ